VRKKQRPLLSAGACLYKTVTAKIRRPEFAAGIADMNTKQVQKQKRLSFFCSPVYQPGEGA
jgi:hypothetical protein